MIPAGWTIELEGDTAQVVAPLGGPGGVVVHQYSHSLQSRLLYALAHDLAKQAADPQPPAPVPQADPLRAELEALALQMDRWAAESVAGSWSTHQVEPMRREAHRIRVLLARHRGAR